MKCKACNGTGKRSANYEDIFRVCEVCGGKGFYEVESSYGMERVECGCQATQTNEEWLNSLNTKEKAKWLSRNSKFMYGCGRMETTPKIMYEEDWEWWLKEKHDGN